MRLVYGIGIYHTTGTRGSSDYHGRPGHELWDCFNLQGNDCMAISSRINITSLVECISIDKSKLQLFHNPGEEMSWARGFEASSHSAKQKAHAYSSAFVGQVNFHLSHSSTENYGWNMMERTSTATHIHIKRNIGWTFMDVFLVIHLATSLTYIHIYPYV